MRGVRPIERELEGRNDPEAQAVRGYCLAVRSAITDDGRTALADQQRQWLAVTRALNDVWPGALLTALSEA